MTHRLPLLVPLIVGFVAACSSTSTSTAGTTAAVTTPREVLELTIGTDDGPDNPGGAEIAHFVETVDGLSGGSITIVPTWHTGDQQSDWDQVAAGKVVDGTFDLGLVPSRAWESEGVTSLRALDAPMLVTSTEQLAAVVADPVADDLLAGLETIGITGLALVPEEVRHVFSFGAALMAPADFQGLAVRAPSGLTTNAALEALGTTVDDYAEGFDEGVADGTIGAAESSFRFAADLPASTTATGNLNLFTKVQALVANTARFGELTADQRQILQQAAKDTRDWTAAQTAPDAELAQGYCGQDGYIELATAAQLADFAAAFEPVYADLEQDATTAGLIDRIRAIVARVGDPQPVAACGPSAGVVVATLPEPPTVTDGTQVALTVDTQFGAPTSSVTSAGGAFAGCTTVDNLDVAIETLSPDVDLFSGGKLLHCPGGTVTIHFDALQNRSEIGVTTGTWSIETSTLAGAASGGGQLAGDGTTCTPAAGSDGCITDAYTGMVTG